MKVFLSNLLWFVSTLPDTIRFALALRNPAHAQAVVARRRKPTKEEDVILYEPTSGSTGANKLIPYTEQLRREFMRAVNPWMASLYLRHPGLFLCTHYWAISPTTEVHGADGDARCGFAEDREYLGSLRCRITRTLFPVSDIVRGVRAPASHLRLTALGLLASRRLGIVSVWHPSFFIRILEYMTEHAAELAHALATGDWDAGFRKAPIREGVRLGERLAARNYAAVWPHLKVISCWDAAFAKADADRLRQMFPCVEVEGKGLLATEGVVTIPWFGKRVAAVTSHTLAFETVDPETSEPIPGTAVGVDRLEVGRRYGVVLTTGNGFTDYRLGDVVECVGFVGRTPRLEFLYRSGGVSDLCGEKLHPAFVGTVISELSERHGAPRFAVLAPNINRAGYTLWWEPAEDGELPSADELERRLCESYYYANAVELGQIRPAVVKEVGDGLARWCRCFGLSVSGAKIPPLTRNAIDLYRL